MRLIRIATFCFAACTLGGELRARVGSSPSALATADLARTTAARLVAAALLPRDAYEPVARESLSSFTRLTMMRLAVEHPDEFWFLRGDLSPLTTRGSDANLERKRAIERIVRPEIKGLIDKLEIATRDNLAKEYAARFTLSQLEELIEFSRTSTGAAFARQNFDIQRTASSVFDAYAKAGDPLDRTSEEARAVLRKLGPAMFNE